MKNAWITDIVLGLRGKWQSGIITHNFKIESEVFMSEKNMSLLSQAEIDALIAFLSDKKGENPIDGETLSQSSINKLIELVKSIPSLDKNILLNKAAIKADASSFFTNKNDVEGYELTFKVDGNGQLNLFACNIKTDDIITITPQMMSEINNDSYPKTWGVLLSPASFCLIADLLKLNYSDETFDKLKALFAEKMYGNANVTIPAFYLP